MINITKDFESVNGVFSPKNGFSTNYGFSKKGNKIVSEDGKYMLSWITPNFPRKADIKLLMRDDVTYKEIDDLLKSTADWRTNAGIFELIDGVKYNFNFKDGTRETRYGFPSTNLIGLIPVNSKVKVTSNSHWDDYLGEYIDEYQIAAIPIPA